MRVEGVEAELAADVGDAVGAQDVEGEAAEPGEVAWFGGNAAVVFEEADIADVSGCGFRLPTGNPAQTRLTRTNPSCQEN